MPLVANDSELGKQVNALHEAISKAAEEDGKHFYAYIEETPQTSLMVEVVQHLNWLGYQITKKN